MRPHHRVCMTPSPVLLALAGSAALLSGLGLGRFAFTPLLPAMVQAGWFSPGGAAAQGAANLAGYLAGAALAFTLARRLRLGNLLRLGMLAVALSLAVCATQPPGWLFGAARFLSGAAGGVLMVLGPPAVLAALPVAVRGKLNGLVFAGVGVGIAASSLALPALLAVSVAAAWWALAAASLLLAVLSWPYWPPAPPAIAPSRPDPRLKWLVVAYAISAVAIVPHMLLLSDFSARGLAAGVTWGAIAFVVYGLGAIAGPLAGGAVASRIGFDRTLVLALGVQAGCVAAPAILPVLPVAIASGFLAGALTPGIPPLVLGRAAELAGIDAARKSWAGATIAYAALQAIGAWAVAWAFAAFRLYAPLFAGAALCSVVAILLLPRGGVAPAA
jgi:predicted MFS family arabinose efflux permease